MEMTQTKAMLNTIMYDFMLATLYKLYPNFDEYPIDDMAMVEYTKGDSFENTQYENIKYLQEAYYMNKLIIKFRDTAWRSGG